MRMREIVHFRVRLQPITRLAGIGEERDRWLAANEDELLGILEELDDLFGEIGNAVDPDAPRATLQPRDEGIARDARARLCRDAACGRQSAFLEHGAAH